MSISSPPIVVFVTLFATAFLVVTSASSYGQRPPGPPPHDGPPPGHPGGPPGPRVEHTETKASPLRLVPANRQPPEANQVTITEEGEFRIIRSNDIPEHKVGRFPNRDNPNEISEQRVNLRLPLHPKANLLSTEMRGPIGVALNGVYFDPGTAEFWKGDRALGWNYEALGGAVRLGLDTNYAHVQPTGKYHYHGSPTGYLEGISFSPEEHSPLIGWAIDGFPIYALYGYQDPEDESSGIKKLKSSYRLISGMRPRSPKGPGGRYDGAFVQDYEYVKGLGDLDDSNGRFAKTPEFPEGTYAYFLTEDWPVIPRRLRGTPVDTPRNPHRH